jgi:pyridoxal 5'-phosphate synthase pdxT subunit
VTQPLIGVLALQGDVREHAAALEACGARVVPVRRPQELDALDGIVLPGGESTVMEKLLRRNGMFEPLREHLAAGLPAYGSCAGMILLADRIANPAPGQTGLGGLDVTVRRNAFGRQVDSFEDDLDAPGLGAGPEGAPLHAVFIRAPWIEEVGPDVEVLARISADAPAGVAERIVAVRSGALLATAFHPEIGDDLRVHRQFLATVDSARGARPRHARPA